MTLFGSKSNFPSMISGEIVYQELLMPLEDKLPSLIEGGGFNRVVEGGFAVFMGYVG